ncbi:MAG: YqgE/AlgH family protein [Magnetospirillum sp.]|nr:YqgE/AlgH family protein [Magnetospirillum sp.]
MRRARALLLGLCLLIPAGVLARGQDAAEADIHHPPPPSLAGRLLVASPGMAPNLFSGTVVLVCSHDASGGFGFIVNRRAGKVEATEDRKGLDGVPLELGGPVGNTLLFLLMKADDAPADAMRVAGRFAIGNPEPYFADAVGHPSPNPSLLVAGYSGWGAGQMEEEIARGDWIVVDADDDLIFDASDEAKWLQALKRKGLDL